MGASPCKPRSSLACLRSWRLYMPCPLPFLFYLINLFAQFLQKNLFILKEKKLIPFFALETIYTSSVLNTQIKRPETLCYRKSLATLISRFNSLQNIARCFVIILLFLFTLISRRIFYRLVLQIIRNHVEEGYKSFYTIRSETLVSKTINKIG